MAVDKKNSHGVKRIVYLRKIGDAGRGAEDVSDELLLRIMSPAVEVVPHGPIVGEVRVLSGAEGWTCCCGTGTLMLIIQLSC